MGKMTAVASNPMTDLWVLNETGERVGFESLWQEKPILIFFMRNIGCGICRQTLLNLRDYDQAFKDAGWQIVVLMMGNVELVSRFRSMYNIPFPIYVDQSLQVYDYLLKARGCKCSRHRCSFAKPSSWSAAWSC